MILKYLNHDIFSILNDEFRNVSGKKQMFVVFYYVNKGHIMKHMLGLDHVTKTSSLNLKESLDALLEKQLLWVKLFQIHVIIKKMFLNKLKIQGGVLILV